MAKYKCDICGHIHDEQKEGPISTDIVCPICGADRSHYIKI